MRARIWRECKPFVWLAVLVVLYAIVRFETVRIAGGNGVLSPGGAVDGTLATLVLATLILRIVVLVVVPFVVTYWLVMRWLSDRRATHSAPREIPPPDLA